MSLELVETMFSAVERNDVDTYLSCFTENAEYRVANLSPIIGRKAIGEFGASLIPMFNKVEHKVKNTWQNGSTIISEMDLIYHRKDGKVVTVPCVDIVEVENGKVKSLRAYLDASPAFS
jgi:ketosteroid isomerase-like protein